MPHLIRACDGRIQRSSDRSTLDGNRAAPWASPQVPNRWRWSSTTVDTVGSRVGTGQTGQIRNSGRVSDNPVHHPAFGSAGDLYSACNSTIYRRHRRITTGGTWAAMLRVQCSIARGCKSRQIRGILLRVQPPECKLGPGPNAQRKASAHMRGRVGARPAS